jgi:hypothetical protein
MRWLDPVIGDSAMFAKVTRRTSIAYWRRHLERKGRSTAEWETLDSSIADMSKEVKSSDEHVLRECGILTCGALLRTRKIVR